MNRIGDDGDLGLSELMTHAAWLRRLAVSLVRDGDAADDVVQATLVAAWSQPPATDRDVRPWLAEVARNQAHDQRRGEGRRRAREEIAAAVPEFAGAAAPGSPEQLIGDLEIHRTVAEIVTALDPIYRDAVVWHFYDGIAAADIAMRAGIPAGTVRWRIKEGLDRVRAELDRRHGGDRKRWQLALLPLLPADLLGRRPSGAKIVPVKAGAPPAAVAPRAGLAIVGVGAAGATFMLLIAYVLWAGPHAGSKAPADPMGSGVPSAAGGGNLRVVVAPPNVPRFAGPAASEEDPEAGRAQREADGIMRRMLQAIADHNYDAFVEQGHDLFKAALSPAQMRALSAELADRLRGGYEALPLGSLRKTAPKMHPTIYLWKLQLNDGGADLLIELGLVDGAVVGFFKQ